MLVFVLDASGENPLQDLEVLEREVGSHSAMLLERPRMVVLSKADLVPPEEREGLGRRLGLPEARLISSHTGDGVKELMESCWSVIVPPPSESAQHVG
jgi:GTPase involved in cell partitioning and DNA repair